MKIKRVIRQLLLLALSFTFIYISQAEEKKHFLWEVQSDSTTVYLLGSVHLAKNEIYPLDEIIEECYAKSDVVVAEIDITEVNPNDMSMELTYQDSTTIEDHLSDSSIVKLKAFMAEINMPYLVMKKFKPEYLFLTITGFELMKKGYNPEAGIDMHFLKKAKNTKEILSLETVESQLALFETDDSLDMDAYIDYSIKDFKYNISQMDILFEAWKKGDTKMIDSLTRGVADEYPEMESVMYDLLDGRNIKMTEKIEAYLQTKKIYFVIVGAAHLTGDVGIVELLNKKGIYRIKQL